MIDTGSSGRSARVLSAIVSWSITIVNGKGIFPKIDPNEIVLDKQTLRRVGKVVAIYSTRPLVQGTAFLLELIARLLLLILFLALSCSPRHRTVVVERVRGTLETQVNAVRRYARLLCSSAPAPQTNKNPPALCRGPRDARVAAAPCSKTRVRNRRARPP